MILFVFINIIEQTVYEVDMTILMLILIALAYLLLWGLVIGCTRIINRTGETGYTSRDVINSRPQGASSRRMFRRYSAKKTKDD